MLDAQTVGQARRQFDRLGGSSTGYSLPVIEIGGDKYKIQDKFINPLRKSHSLT